ncbi:MAG: inorganic phosphate transporter [Oscillospiraceae bacterium]|nr:inorganic phosphate transporter [Oscillospiraceae bacterium]
MYVPVSFLPFLRWLGEDTALAVSVLLTLGVLLVNGWTDAPNAIACAVVTGAMPFPAAAAMAAVCNFLGVLCVTSINTSVAQTIYEIADFGSSSTQASIALCAAMTAIVLWATFAWRLGIPTSESHALIAGISGAAIALKGFGYLRPEAWIRVLWGLILSTGAGFILGRLSMALTARLPGKDGVYRLAQVPGAALTAFLHGAQDGQKFLGIFVLGVSLARGWDEQGVFVAPMWLILLCAGTIALGTALGGRRIIDRVGRDMVDLTPRRGFAADLAGCICLLAATVWGLPVSTTHTRTTALLGVSAQENGRTDKGVICCIIWTWLLTFPGCGIIGFAMARLFLRLFVFR